FAENIKVDGSTRLVFRPGSQIRTNLKTVKADGSTEITDGLLATFHPIHNNTVDAFDVEKFSNFTENFSLYRDGKYIAIERRKPVQAGDTLFFRLRNLTINNFQFEFAPDSLADPLLSAFLVDKYLQTETPVSLTDTTRINFNIAANPPGNWAEDRFMLVFKQISGGVIPVKISDVKAYQQQQDIAVEWTVQNEINIEKYAVEASSDGRNFTPVNYTMAVAQNRTQYTYKWLDVQPQAGDHFYRIKSISNTGEVEYSRIVKVTIGKVNGGMLVYPNPVKNNTIGLVMTKIPAGTFKAEVFNGIGQILVSKAIQHNGGSANYSIAPTNVLPAGVYQLRVSGAEGVVPTVISVVVE
ncbi:MAG: T9SS type A sorting domain-containing protein, partial [Ferruginibacter sp.]